MRYLYTCNRYNPHVAQDIHAIVDETELISSPAYLHAFVNECTSENYYVISDTIGIPMPHLGMEHELIIGTSRYIYFISYKTKSITQKILTNSPCIHLDAVQNKIITICENDVMIITMSNENDVKTISFDDVIVNYVICDQYLTVSFMDNKLIKINLDS